MQALPPTTLQLRQVRIEKPIGGEGFRAVAEALQTHSGLLSRVSVMKDAFDGAKSEDMRVVWDALHPTGVLALQVGRSWRELQKEDGEGAWQRCLYYKQAILRQ